MNSITSSDRFDDAVVGAGILGLAHAFHLARRGRRVIVFERSQRACGASVRNFGMLWPIGQPRGPMHQLATRSRAFWLQVLAESGIWHERTGSLHLAYHSDEAQVLAEFVEQARADGEACGLLTPAQVTARSPAVKALGLQAGMWSASETCVDPRQVIAELPRWLAEKYGVRFEFGTAVTGFEQPRLFAGGRVWHAERLFVCAGDDFQTLYPEAFANSGMVRCKLQMMRTQPYAGAFRLGPMLAGGLTLRHYKNFESCPSLAAVRARVTRDNPEFDRYGIHVMASQNGLGEVILGDSHLYESEIAPFDDPEIDRLILEYLSTFLELPNLHIASRWHGIYAKHPQGYFVAQPASAATVVTGVGGAGMTLSFGLADDVVRNLLE